MVTQEHSHGFTHDEIAYGAFCIFQEEQRNGQYSGQDAHWFAAIERLGSIRAATKAVAKAPASQGVTDVMTIDGFRRMMDDEAAKRMALDAYVNYIKRKCRADKYLREEHLPILAVVRYKKLPGTDTIELGNEKQGWDACVNGIALYEVVQALPDKEHEVRRSLVGDARTMVEISDPEPEEPTHVAATGATAQMILLIQHANDHLTFPKAIIDAIEMKHSKMYKDMRTLVVAVDGDYTGEDDAVIEEWLRIIRKKTTRGTFKEILLVEVARLKVFEVF